VLNQPERRPMPVEDQVVQIFAATNGYLDRIDLDRVNAFLAGLVESARGNEPELMKTIGGGDWSEQTQSQIDKAVAQYAEDFGYDLDEEGHPLESDDQQLPPSRRSESPEERGEVQDSSDNRAAKEDEVVPA
jgi:F-type H+-transporting ATPase subunit alpha